MHIEKGIRTTPNPTKEREAMTIYQALKKDHGHLKDLLQQLVSLNDDSPNRGRAKDLVGKIRDALIPHSRAEEQVVYNSLRLIDETKGLGWHGYMEHAEAEGLLRALQMEVKTDMHFHKTAVQLQETLLHHIHDEEDQMFSAAREVFSDEEARMMVQPFQALKGKAKDEGFLKTSLELVANMMPPRLSAALGLTKQV
jgi:hemerythrin superfamily protein